MQRVCRVGSWKPSSVISPLSGDPVLGHHRIDHESSRIGQIELLAAFALRRLAEYKRGVELASSAAGLLPPSVLPPPPPLPPPEVERFALFRFVGTVVLPVLLLLLFYSAVMIFELNASALS